MHTLEQIIAGLTLINTKSESGKYVTAEHDEIWAGYVPEFTEEEIKQMEEWGWTLSEYESFHRFV